MGIAAGHVAKQGLDRQEVFTVARLRRALLLLLPLLVACLAACAGTIDQTITFLADEAWESQATLSFPAEVAVLIADPYQGHGLGSELMRRLLDVARSEKIEHVTGYIHPENTAMVQLVKKMGFTMKWEDGVDEASIDLKQG